MIHKKMVLSVIIIAFVGITAASTWANFSVSAESGGNTLQAGTIGIKLYETTGAPFTVTGMVPDSTINDIRFHQLVWPQSGQYAVTVQNTGNLDASLFISDILTSDPSSLADHVALYYSIDGTSESPIKITSTPTDTKINIPAGGNRVLFFWYSYENDGDQTSEMGKTVDAVINFELRNPDTPVPGAGI